MSEIAEIKIRSVRPGDEPFIINSYLNSYRSSPLVSSVPKGFYYSNQTEVIKLLMAESAAKVACNPEDEDQIYGYVLASETSEFVFCHWVYIKGPFRRFGVATKLLADLPQKTAFYTHFNEFQELFKKHKAKYVPWFYLFNTRGKL